MYCAKCGNKMQSGEAFCQKCGTPRRDPFAYSDNAAGSAEEVSSAKSKETSAVTVANVGAKTSETVTAKPVGKNDKEQKKKKPGVIIAIAAVLAVAIIGVVLFLIFHGYRSVKIEEYKGDVELERSGKEKDIFEGLKLIADDKVTTGEDGTVELLIDTDKHLVAAENTCFSVNAAGSVDSGKVMIKLEYGSTLATIDEKLSENSEFEIETPNCTCSVRGTIFRVTYDPATNTTTVEVTEGVVRVKTKSQKMDLNPGEKAVIKDDVISVTTGGAGNGAGASDEEDDTRFASMEEAKEAIDDGNWDDGRAWSDRADILPFMTDEGYVVFGAYEQEGPIYGGNTGNGPEPIEWEVLGADENGTLLVSRYVLDDQCYDTEQTDITWENSSLRVWLNDDFYRTAFTERERELINEVCLDNSEYESYGEVATGGSATYDKVFLLNVEELREHDQLSYDRDEYEIVCGQKLIIASTGYVDQGVEISSSIYGSLVEFNYTQSCIGQEGTDWWLRNKYGGHAMACVDSLGMIYPQSCDDKGGVRPAIYISEHFDDLAGTVEENGNADRSGDESVTDNGTANEYPSEIVGKWVVEENENGMFDDDPDYMEMSNRIYSFYENGTGYYADGMIGHEYPVDGLWWYYDKEAGDIVVHYDSANSNQRLHFAYSGGVLHCNYDYYKVSDEDSYDYYAEHSTLATEDQVIGAWYALGSTSTYYFYEDGTGTKTHPSFDETWDLTWSIEDGRFICSDTGVRFMNGCMQEAYYGWVDMEKRQ